MVLCGFPSSLFWSGGHTQTERKHKQNEATGQECDLRIMYRNTAILAVPAGGRPDRLGFCGQDDRKPSTGGTPMFRLAARRTAHDLIPGSHSWAGSGHWLHDPTSTQRLIDHVAWPLLGMFSSLPSLASPSWTVALFQGAAE